MSRVWLQRSAHKGGGLPRALLGMRAPLLSLVLLLAGCAAPAAEPAPPEEAPDAPPETTSPPPAFAEAPPAEAAAAAPCEAPRAAVRHDERSTQGIARALLCVFDTGLHGSETTLGVCPGTGALYAGPAWGDAAGAGSAATLDGGATWSLLVPTAAGQPTHRVTLDPYLYVDPVTCRIFVDDLTSVNCSLLSWSDDGGATWSHGLSGCLETDHQTLFAGPPAVSSTLGYPNVVYRCAINLVATASASAASTCQRSLDGGLTWLPPGTPAFVTNPLERGHGNMRGACDGATGHGLVDSMGRVYLPKGCSQPWIAWSDDEGLTWTRAQVSDLGMKMDNGGILDHDGSVAIDAAGTLYYAWIAADRMPHLVLSTDRGASWVDAGSIAPPGLRDAAQASLDVTPDGLVALAYYGSYDAADAVEVQPCEEDPQACVVRALTHTDVGNDGSWMGHVSLIRGAGSESMEVWTATTGDAALVKGACGVRCQDAADFRDTLFTPDGAAWATFVDVAGGKEALLVARLA